MPSVLQQPGIPAVPQQPDAPQTEMRDFLDTGSARNNIYNRVLESMGQIGPLANKRHTLTLAKLRYVDPDDLPLQRQKEAILSGRSLYRRIKGTWQLTDNESGKVLDQKEQTIAQVPYYTPRGTFVINGTEYTMSNQMRLRPGVFTRIKDNGEIESHVNVLPGNGVSHRYFLDPESGVFKINIGQAKLPLFPVIKALGATDRDLREAWGDALLGANMQAGDAKTINKLYSRIIKRGDPLADDQSKAQAVAQFLSAMKFDPEVTKRTLGAPYEHLDKDAILATTKKLIRVSKQEEDPDDRDHLAYQTLVGPEDVLSERLTKDKAFLRQLLWKASFKGNLSGVQPGILTQQLHNAVLRTGLGQSAEEINAAELLDALGRTTRLGEGGIGSIDAVPDEARSVQPSQFGLIDPVRTPESFRAGIDNRLVYTAKKGRDGRIYTVVNDARTGKPVYKSPQDLADAVVAFPGSLRKGDAYVPAQVGGTTEYVPREKVDYELPHMENAFSPLANMIPLKSAIKGQRLAMGSRYLAQALPLTTREAPLVQTAMPGRHMDRSFEDEFGTKMGAIRADQGGTVYKVDSSGITVRQDDGKLRTYELYNNFPYARKTFIHNDPTVAIGQRIEPNQLLARSNYTDDQGTTALGLNAYVGFLPYKGANYEDAAVISESFAKRLSSEQMYASDQDWDDKIKQGRKSFVSLFPTEYEKEQLKNIDDNGVVKPGTVVKFGDPLILVAEERERTHSQIHRGRKPSYANKSQVWEHYSPGIVTDVVPTAKGVTVAIKSVTQMKVGDKLSNRYGGKGVVSMILPDDQMPRGKDDRPFEILLNPLGMISRINPAQKAEAILAKIAKITGKPYKIEDFTDIEDLAKFTEQEMQKHGVPDKEEVVDPATGRSIPDVLTGYQYLLKLHHTSEAKGQGRGIGGYTSEEVPAKGGVSGSKRIALLETNALLSHGATEFLRDAHLVRGQKNDMYWQAVMSGFRPPEPQIPLVYKKFVEQLRGSGINVVRNGRQLQIMALTNKDVDELTGGREIENTETVDWKEGLKPKRGGFFDPALTGGHGGNRWAAISLYEPMPNPAFEEPIRRLLGLTQKKFEAVLAGQEGFKGERGPKAIQKALENINLKEEINKAKAEAAGSKKTARDDAVRRLEYLESTARLKIHPKDWILHKVPVLPPIFRPVSVMQNTGNPLVSDANHLYKELYDSNQALKDLSGRVSDTSNERMNVYNAFKGVVGLGDPISPKNQGKVRGLLSHIFGTSPKFGMVQRQLLGSTVELVGRAVIAPNPDYDMDQVGLPENKAWDVYKPFIIRRLVQRGVPRLEAARAFTEQKPIARDALQAEMEHRPVVISRAPVLHRYGIMGFWPRLIKGDVMQIPPLVTKGFNADFDGDTMNYHVPATDEARQEVIDKLLPSRNLLSASDFKVHQMPSQEYVGGLYYASTSKDDKSRAHVFATAADAIRAYNEGRISLKSAVEIIKP